MPDLTPLSWITAGEGVIGTMQHWVDVDRHPTVLRGDPRGDVSECGCDSGDSATAGGVVLVTAGPVVYMGDQFPNADTQRRRFSEDCPDVWGVEVTVKFARCRPVFEQNSLARPSKEKRAAYAKTLHDDAWAIWTALRCAQPQWSKRIGTVVVGGFSPIEEDIGPCGGYQFTYIGKVKPCEECPPLTPP